MATQPWSLFDPSTYEGEDTAPPGGYTTPGVMPFASQAMGMLNPLLAPLGQAMGVDKALLSGILGQNMFSAQGSWNRSTNYSNIALNRMDRSATESIRSASNNVTEEFKIRMMQGMSSSVGGPQMTRKEAQGQISKGMWSPQNMAADFMAAEYGLPALGRRAESTYLGMGGFAMTGSDPVTGLPRKADAATQARLDSFTAGSSAIMTDFSKKGPGQYGGLKGGEVGMLQDMLAKSTGGFMKDGKAMNTADITKDIQSMSKAMGSMKEMFNKEIPELLKQLKDTFGHNPFASYSPDTMNTMVKQMKHSARLAGTSVESVMQMAQVAEGYASSIGAGRSGGGMMAATYATNMLGTNAGGDKFVNMDLYRSTVLKQVTSAAQSPLARAISGARAMFKGTDEEFQAKLGNMGSNMNIAGLTKEFGFAAGDIAAAASSDKARVFRDTSDIAANAALRTTEVRAGKRAGTNLDARLKGVGIKSVAGLDLTGLSPEEATKKIMAANNMAEDDPRKTVVEGHVNTVMDSMARKLGFEGKEAYEKFKVQRKEGVRLGAESKRRTEFEKSVEDVVGKGGFGFAGIGQAIQDADPKKGLTIASAMAGAFGLTTEDIGKIGNQGVVSKTMKNLGGFYSDKMLAAKDLDERNKLRNEEKKLSTLLTSSKDEFGEDISKEDKMAVLEAAKSGNPAKIAAANKLFLSKTTKEGAKEDMISRAKGELAGFSGLDKVSKEDNKRLKETIPMLMGLKDSMQEGEFKNLMGDTDLSKLTAAQITETMAGMSDEDRGNAMKAIEKNKKAMGGGANNNSTEGILQQLIELITPAIEKFISGNKADTAPIMVKMGEG
jgi:hypothetical protein